MGKETNHKTKNQVTIQRGEIAMATKREKNEAVQ